MDLGRGAGFQWQDGLHGNTDRLIHVHLCLCIMLVGERAVHPNQHIHTRGQGLWRGNHLNPSCRGHDGSRWGRAEARLTVYASYGLVQPRCSMSTTTVNITTQLTPATPVQRSRRVPWACARSDTKQRLHTPSYLSALDARPPP